MASNDIDPQDTLDRIRAKYPQYDDIEDADLAKSVYEKYPQAYPELLDLAKPARAAEYGEIKAAPNLWEQFKADVSGGLTRTASVNPLEMLAGVGTAVGAPFRALGGATERVAAEVLPESVQDRRGYDFPGRLGSAVETFSALGPGIKLPAALAERGVARAAAREAAATAPAVAPRAPRALPQYAGPSAGGPGFPGTATPTPRLLTRTPEGVVARGQRVIPQGGRPPVWTEEGFAPAAEEWTRQSGKIDPQVLYGAGRAALGGAAGASQGETGIDKIRYGLVGAALGAAAKPSLIRSLASAAKTRATTGYMPGDFVEAVAKAKASPGSNLFFTPQDIAKGIPSAQNLVRDAYAAHDIAKVTEKEFLKRLSAVYKPVLKDQDAVVRIHQALDGQAVSLTPQEVQVSRGVRRLFDDMASRAGLPVEEKLADYFPHVREAVTSSLRLKIGKEGAPVVKEIPQEYKVFFRKKRTLPTDETLDFGLAPVQMYARAAAKQIAMKGGRMIDDTPVEGFVDRVGKHLDELPDVPEIQAYFRDYVNDILHGPKRAPGVMTPAFAAKIKQVEFMRTIGGNLMSPMVNLTQTLNTYAVTNSRSWMGAWYDVRLNPAVQKLARKYGVGADLLKADIEDFSSPDRMSQLLKGTADKLGILFKKAEDLNRMHAFAAGYRYAKQLGKTGDDAVRHALDVVDLTQFRFGIENAPAWLRGGSPELSVLGQFKNYQINQMLFLKNLATSNPKGLMRWMLGVGLIAGPDAITGTSLGQGIRRQIAQAFGGDPEDFKFRGLFGEMGWYLGEQIGLGALPIESVSDLAFMLPGPALSHILEAASVVMNKNITVQAFMQGRGGERLTPDQWAGMSARSLPVGVQLNRMRQAAQELATPGPNLRSATNLQEAVGLAPATGGAIRAKERPAYAGPVRKVIGIQSLQAAEEHEQRQSVAKSTQYWNDLVRQKAEAIRAGNTDEVRRLNKLGMQEFGRIPRTTPRAMRGAAERARTPSAERQLRNAPRPIRRKLREEVND